MAISQKPAAAQTQKLALTWQMLQSIEFLQLSTIELSERISRELIENPVLEEMEDSAIPEYNLDQDAENSVSRNLSGGESDFDEQDEKSADFSDASDTGFANERDTDKKRNFVENAVAREESLSEHLLAQAGALAESESELGLFQKVITSLDENGFLCDPRALGEEDAEEAERVIAAIQQCDPVGCAAGGVRESLIIQAGHYYPADEGVGRILKDFFPDFEKLNYEKIAKGMNLPVPQIIEKSKMIQMLNPYPGRHFSGRNTGYIMADIDVRVVDGEIVVTLNDEWVPKIRINSYYLALLGKKSIEKNLKDFIQDRVNSARGLIRNISGRRETILKVAREVMQCQKDFLVRGPGHLKPLTHLAIARSTGLSESTISRVTGSKYVQTSWGVHVLKFFFAAKMKSKDGAGQSSDQVIKMVADVIEREKKNNPVSDDEIVKILANAGIHAARRTVAKYRGMLDIPSSHKRKKINMIKKEE